MMKVNIDQMSEDELVELNHKIVARLRFLRQMQSHAQMLDYRIGERVRFYPAGQPEVTGTLTRYNKKSVTVITDSGQHWNVHPGLLHKNTIWRSREKNGQGAHRYVSPINIE